jgi:hypothetical protein
MSSPQAESTGYVHLSPRILRRPISQQARNQTIFGNFQLNAAMLSA